MTVPPSQPPFDPETQAELQTWPLGTFHAPPYLQFPACKCAPCRDVYEASLVFPARVSLTHEQYLAALEEGKARWGRVVAAGRKREDGTRGDELSHVRGALSEMVLALHLGVDPNWTPGPDHHSPDVGSYYVRTANDRLAESGRMNRLWVYEEYDQEGAYVLVLPAVQGRFGSWSIEGWQTLPFIKTYGDLHAWRRGQGETLIRYLPSQYLIRQALP